MKILSILTQSKEAKEQKAAERVARALSRGQEALIDKLEARKDDLAATKDRLLSISVNTVNLSTWNQEYHDAIIELKLIDAEIKAAKEVGEELFTEVEK